MTKLPLIATVVALFGLHFAAPARLHSQEVYRGETKPNTLTEAEKRGGWKLLFDGETTKGWRNYRKNTVSDSWKAINGELVRTAPGGGDIVTLDQYDNFELLLEYKISPDGNSGVLFRVTEEGDESWHSGPEIQLSGKSRPRAGAQKAGWLYQLYDSDVDATRPDGEWNQIALRVTPTQCEQYMNGYRYCRYVIGNADWNRRVAKSKFAAYPFFGKAERGFICLQDHPGKISFRNIKIRKFNDDGTVQDPVDGAMPLKAEIAFPDLKWTGWEPVDDRGRSRPLRPIVLTHSGDGSNRVFVATQQGIIHVFPNNQSAAQTKIFLDISRKVTYNDRQDEEGLLGVAFHPDYKQNGQFFVMYTSSEAPHTTVLSRFRVSPNDPNMADPQFEEELIRTQKENWNHNGGTIVFGPDKYLYVAFGDGGGANDPLSSGQSVEDLFGSILRIDVNRKQDGKNYAIPADNPFVSKPKARGEVWAFGLRNVWRMAFDRSTGDFWAADVGQNLFEEINIITKGGNYGWSIREASHPFGPHGSDRRDDLIDPIWEYDHEVGKSITGGSVYRGKSLPELVGAYLYADYVTGKVFALRYDLKEKKVASNQLIRTDKLPVISFGEDETGEVYFTSIAPNGKGIHRFVRNQ